MPYFRWGRWATRCGAATGIAARAPQGHGPLGGVGVGRVMMVCRGLERLGGLTAGHGRGDLAAAPVGSSAGSVLSRLTYFVIAKSRLGGEWAAYCDRLYDALSNAYSVTTGEGTG